MIVAIYFCIGDAASYSLNLCKEKIVPWKKLLLISRLLAFSHMMTVF
jgi:hypothetical protein